MTNEFEMMDNKFGQERKTQILNEDGEVNEMDMVKNSRSGESNSLIGWVEAVVYVCVCVSNFPFPSLRQ